eukprot:1064572-Rhodomonas_salina.1
MALRDSFVPAGAAALAEPGSTIASLSTAHRAPHSTTRVPGAVGRSEGALGYHRTQAEGRGGGGGREGGRERGEGRRRGEEREEERRGEM